MAFHAALMERVNLYLPILSMMRFTYFKAQNIAPFCQNMAQSKFSLLTYNLRITIKHLSIV
jgi:hypothetical protein